MVEGKLFKLGLIDNRHTSVADLHIDHQVGLATALSDSESDVYALCLALVLVYHDWVEVGEQCLCAMPGPRPCLPRLDHRSPRQSRL